MQIKDSFPTLEFDIIYSELGFSNGTAPIRDYHPTTIEEIKINRHKHYQETYGFRIKMYYPSINKLKLYW